MDISLLSQIACKEHDRDTKMRSEQRTAASSSQHISVVIGPCCNIRSQVLASLRHAAAIYSCA